MSGLIRSRTGLTACLAAEAFACLAGFGTAVHLARTLQPAKFATLETAFAATAWLLVLVRGGLDQIVVREAARHPRLIGRLTSLLIWLRLGWAVVGLLILAVAAAVQGTDRGLPLLAAGLLLLPAALAPDVGPRARQELRFLAGISVLRGAGIWVSVLLLVRNPENLSLAALVPSAVECLIAGCWMAHEGLPTVRFPSSTTLKIFSRRAAIAGLTRFGRVGLYLADILVLGLAADAGVGSYAAARRVVFAVVAVGIVVPTVLGPTLAKQRTNGSDAASHVLAQGMMILLCLFVPAAIGLILIAPRGLPTIFGATYEGNGWMPIMLALRLPVVLIGTWLQTASISLGHERQALRLTAIVGALALVALPFGAVVWGTVGIASVVLVLELISMLGSWSVVRSCGIRLHGELSIWPVALGSLAMTLAVLPLRSGPLVPTILIGVVVYATIWWLASRAPVAAQNLGKVGP